MKRPAQSRKGLLREVDARRPRDNFAISQRGTTPAWSIFVFRFGGVLFMHFLAVFDAGQTRTRR